MAWTDKEVQVLRELWDEGRSASQIAAVLGGGKTDNGVLGKAHRLRLPRREPPPGSRAAREDKIYAMLDQICGGKTRHEKYVLAPRPNSADELMIGVVVELEQLEQVILDTESVRIKTRDHFHFLGWAWAITQHFQDRHGWRPRDAHQLAMVRRWEAGFESIPRKPIRVISGVTDELLLDTVLGLEQLEQVIPDTEAARVTMQGYFPERARAITQGFVDDHGWRPRDAQQLAVVQRWGVVIPGDCQE